MPSRVRVKRSVALCLIGDMMEDRWIYPSTIASYEMRTMWR
jgi:hypothetical protein